MTINANGGAFSLTSSNVTGAAATGNGSAASTASKATATVGVGVALNLVNANNDATIAAGDTVNAQSLNLGHAANWPIERLHRGGRIRCQRGGRCRCRRFTGD